MIQLRFNGARGIARLITVPCQLVAPTTVRQAARAILASPDSPAAAAALDCVMAEAVPQPSWRTRVVQPGERLKALAPDLQLAVLRALCPGVEVLHGL